jgi:hypothetical protein
MPPDGRRAHGAGPPRPPAPRRPSGGPRARHRQHPRERRAAPTSRSRSCAARLADPAGRPVLEVCLWPDEQQARATGDEVWEVFAHHLGRTVGREPSVAQVVRFRRPARGGGGGRASRRAGDERIWPAVRDLDGLVETLVLEQPSGAELVLTFATSVEHFARAGERIMSTDLLPGEDPALLTGPDRLEVLHVVPSTAPVTA